ncbi:hypothetical protein [Ottowia sp. VDI28]|uniref:hypothetical protein n=1 Tax=Ottowia sp. VDI28 TaxID=3133968 RepID=UPI003C309998
MLLVIAVAILGFIGFMTWYQLRPETVAQRKADADRIAAERLPRKVNEANGCEVWAFKPGDRWLYFTRCGAKTETTNAWNECHTRTAGKVTSTVCTPKTAVITQEPK